VALVVVALVVVASGVAAVLLTGKAPDAAVLDWVPTQSVVYGEMRLDLPGDQRANLGEFLSKFPGFKDQASLDVKITEVLDRLVSSATDGEQTYGADIAPWFDGELAFSMGELPDPATLSDPNAMPAAPDIAVFLSLKDGAKAQAWFDDAIKDASPTTEDYNGTKLTLVESKDDEVDYDMAFAVPGGARVAILGETNAVKAALDTKGDGGLAADPDFAAALAASDADHVGFMFVNLGRYMEWAMELAPAAAPDMCGSAFSANIGNLIPGWVAMRMRVEKDALAMDTAAPMPEEPPVVQENRASAIAARLPASTILFVEGHDLGTTLLASIEMYRSDPACAETLEEIDTAVGFLGGFDDLLGWMGDGALVVNRTADGVEGGVVFQATNADDASDLLGTVKSLLAFAGSAGLTVREETHGDATITVVDLGDATSLLGLAGMSGGVEVPAPGGPGSRLELAWTVSGDLVIVSVGTSFIKHVLDTDEATSLGSNARFAALLDRTAGAENVGVTFADITAMREMLEALGRSDPEAFATYQTDVQPFLIPFDAFIQSSAVGDDRAESKSVITIK
jgi:hypothetical protein